MSDSSKRLAQQIKEQATVLSEAYRARLVGRLWWANLFLVVLPAAFATAAAIFAAGSSGNTAITMPLVAAGLAGTAAVLTAVHKALKCDEYQAECLRLSQAYHGIAIEADSALSSQAKDPSLPELTKEFADMTASAKAALPDYYIRKAEKRTSYTLYGQPAPNVGDETPRKTET